MLNNDSALSVTGCILNKCVVEPADLRQPKMGCGERRGLQRGRYTRRDDARCNQKFHLLDAFLPLLFFFPKSPSTHLSCQTTRRWTPLSWSSHVACVSVRPATAAKIPGSALMTASLSSTTSCLLCSPSSSASPWKDGQPCSITYDNAHTRTHTHTHCTHNISLIADKYWLTDDSSFNLKSIRSNKQGSLGSVCTSLHSHYLFICRLINYIETYISSQQVANCLFYLAVLFSPKREI